MNLDTDVQGRKYRCAGETGTDVGGRIVPMLRGDFRLDCVTKLATCQRVKHIQSFVHKDQNNAIGCCFLRSY